MTVTYWVQLWLFVLICWGVYVLGRIAEYKRIRNDLKTQYIEIYRASGDFHQITFARIMDEHPLMSKEKVKGA